MKKDSNTSTFNPAQIQQEVDPAILRMWSSQLDEGDGAVYNYEPVPIQLLPAPWDQVASASANIAAANAFASTLFSSPPMSSSSTSSTTLPTPSSTQNSAKNSHIQFTWYGLADQDGYTIRKDLKEVQKLRLVKVGRMIHSLHLTEFVSRTESPIEEFNLGGAVPPISVDLSIMTPPKDSKAADKELIRSGDIVKILVPHSSSSFPSSSSTTSQPNERFLSIYKGWWIGSSAIDQKVGPQDCYTVVVLDEDGNVRYGVPLMAGQPFRLRSARWPRYEVGLQTAESGTHLVVYEWSQKPAKGPVRWKNGGFVSPLNLCVTVNEARSSFITSKLQKKSNFLGLGALQSIFCGSSNNNSNRIMSNSSRLNSGGATYDASIVGWVEVLHRTTRQVQLAFLLVSSQRCPNGQYKRWTSLRTVDEVIDIIRTLESMLTHENSNNRGSSTSDSQTAADDFITLQHESSADQTLRKIGYRLENLLAKDCDQDSTFFSWGGGKSSKVGIRQALKDYLSIPSLLDSWFTTGDPQQMGVNIFATSPVYVTIVARALWETHWCEEIVMIYPDHVTFFAAHGKKTSLNLSLKELVGVSPIPAEESPLPGFFLLKIETLGRVHYISFSTYASRERMATALLEQMTESRMRRTDTPPLDGFYFVSGQWQSTTRKILNARKFSFDNQSRSYHSITRDESICELSIRLLREAMELNPATNDDDSLELGSLVGSGAGNVMGISNGGSNGNGNSCMTSSNVSSSINNHESVSLQAMSCGPLREQLMGFLDEVCALKSIDLSHMDTKSAEALCFFVNIYYTLLVHARLVLRPPSKADWATFFSTVSYEIGGDVFSLAEISQCALRGNLSKPKVLSRHDPPLLPATDDHFLYSVALADERINFILTDGSPSFPNNLYLLTPDNYNEQLTRATQIALSHSISVDIGWRCVTLPKVCERCSDDFGPDSTSVLRTVMKYLEGTSSGVDLASVLNDSKPPTLKFLKFTYDSHTKLRLLSA